MFLPAFEQPDVNIITSDVIFKSFLAVKKYQIRFPLFQGGYSAVVTREVLLRPAAAAVLLFDASADVVVLVEQLRPGVIGASASPWILEPVIGMIDPGEDALTAAKREAVEEAGYEVDRLLPVADYWVSPGISDERTIIYCGSIQASQSDEIFGVAAEQENIKPYVMPVADIQPALQAGFFKSAISLISLQWLLLNSHFVKEQWLLDSK